MVTFKERCIELRKRDHTLPEIMKMTCRSKTSVYFHIKNIPLSTAKQSAIHADTGRRAREVAAKRKGKAMRLYTPFVEWTPERVLLVAHLLFDGEIRKGRCVYNNRSCALVARVEYLMRDVYEHAPQRHKNPGSKVHRISYHNVELAAFLQEKGVQLLARVHALPKRYQMEFLRAFFDDEGCMDFRPRTNIRRVRGYQKDKEVLTIVHRLLKNNNIESVLRGDNEVVIVGKENLVAFRSLINFSPGVAVNAHRKNSIWKKPIEKRTLLEMAIASYKTKKPDIQ